MSMDRADEALIPEDIAGDLALTIPLSILAAVPMLGSALSQFITGVTASVQRHRLNAFCERLADRIQALEEIGSVDIEFVRSDDFSLYVLRAAESAASTHRLERLRLLADVAAGGAVTGISDRWRDKFLSVAELIGPDHLRLLSLMQEDEVWTVEREFTVDMRQMSALAPDLEVAEVELLVRDLVAVGLAYDCGTGRLGIGAGEVWRSTVTGRRFLDHLAHIARPN